MAIIDIAIIVIAIIVQSHTSPDHKGIDHTQFFGNLPFTKWDTGSRYLRCGKAIKLMVRVVLYED